VASMLSCGQCNGPSRPIPQRSTEQASEVVGNDRIASAPSRVETPAPGMLYHSVFPGSAVDPGSEDAISSSDLAAYEAAVGHRVAWVYFSHEWAHGEAFPFATAAWIRAQGSVPFVRVMMRSVAETGRTTVEDKYSLASIVSGQHDAALEAWGDEASRFTTPILAEWGTEMNGDWFPWNGLHNGRVKGTALFRAAYQHIVAAVRQRGARNVIWAFHVNGDDQPTAAWNRFEEYYPGDDWVDWIGISAYGAQSPGGPCPDFVTTVDAAVARIMAMAPRKPIFVFEFGTTSNARRCAPNAAAWAGRALDALVGGRWPAVRGFSWWNERWETGRSVTDMRVQNAPAIAQVFRRVLSAGATIDRPLLR
jgi:hypothetical protein